MSIVHLLARWWPLPVDGDADLESVLAFLEWDVDSETVLRAGYGAAVLLGIGGVVLAPVVSPLAAAVCWLSALGAAFGVPAGPKLLATARRNVALAVAPDVVGYATLRVTLDPSTEAAVAFAADSVTGPLAASLAHHVRRADGTERSGVDAFAAAWSDWLPALGRALALVDAATAAPPEERERLLARARTTVLEGVQERTAGFAASLRGPATAVYAFGVLLPLALVAGLPAASAAGLNLSLSVVAIGYGLVLPVGLLAATAWLLAHRPAAFPAPRVTRAHPAVPDSRWRPVGACVAMAVCGWLAASILLPAWTRPIAAIGTGSGTALLIWSAPPVAVHDRARAVETGISDALALVGRRVGEGTPVETAMEETADELTDATGDVLRDAVGRQRRLGVGVRVSLLGDRGALADLPSVRARSAATMLSVATAAGTPAGPALVSMADHLDDLRRLDRETRRELRQVTDTLSNTAAVFGPLVAGAAVALAGGIGARAPGTPLPVPGLGTVMGWYTLVLATVLAVLATGLEEGFVPSRLANRAGRALLSATAVYLLAFVGARALT